MQMFTCLGLSKEKSDDERVKNLQNQIYQLQEDKKQLLEQANRSPSSEVTSDSQFQYPEFCSVIFLKLDVDLFCHRSYLMNKLQNCSSKLLF